MNNSENLKPAVSINVVEEQATVRKEIVEKGKVRITKQVHEEAETFSIPVAAEEVQVEKIPINQIVETVPPVRYDGDAMIIPVVKEVIVIEKKLMLVEEVRVSKRTVQKHEQGSVPLRKEEVIIERIPSENKM